MRTGVKTGLGCASKLFFKKNIWNIRYNLGNTATEESLTSLHSA